MPYYLINKKADEHNLNEVHQTTCPWKPAAINQEPLGYFYSNKEAVAYAKSIGWTHADGCYHCCRDAHHG
jgi:hypothetical protein